MFKDNLKRLRTAAGLTYDELSEKTGYPPSTLKSYENGYRSPKDGEKLFVALAEELNCTTDDLLR